MKHAYLIIAHNEFYILKKLISALDDERNDIYVHIDAKVKALPILTCHYSTLHILQKRVRVIWGDVSQIATEIRLMEEAFLTGNKYDFYHIISGTHYPLVSNQKIFSYFEPYIGKTLLQPMKSSAYDVPLRLGRYNFFLKYYNSQVGIIRKFSQFLWSGCLYLQKICKVRRDVSYNGGKASNWCSLSTETVEHVVAEKEMLLKRFSHTFCADEFFIPSVVKMHDLPVVYTDALLYTDYQRCSPKVLTEADYDTLIKSGCLFARKFTSASLSLMDKFPSNDFINDQGCEYQ